MHTLQILGGHVKVSRARARLSARRAACVQLLQNDISRGRDRDANARATNDTRKKSLPEEIRGTGGRAAGNWARRRCYTHHLGRLFPPSSTFHRRGMSWAYTLEFYVLFYVL